MRNEDFVGGRLLRFVLMLLATLCVLGMELAIANKFETIGGGISGASGMKREWLRGFFIVAGGISAFGAVLAVVVPHRNPLYLNFNNWKTSAVIMSIIAVLMFVFSALI